MLTMIVHAVQCTVYMPMMVICDGYDGYLCKEAEMFCNIDDGDYYLCQNLFV